MPSAINSTDAFTATFTFSEEVTEFVTGDVTLTGGSKGTFSGSGKSYSAGGNSGRLDRRGGDGQGQLRDGRGQHRTGHGGHGHGGVGRDSPDGDRSAGCLRRSTRRTAFTATFTFSEEVTGFVTADVTVTGGSKGTFSGERQELQPGG